MSKHVLILVAAGIFSLSALSQPAQPDWSSPVPLDPKVRIGKLENGMTYYIRANAEPKERAELYIVHNVGATMEEDHQDGLAHFLEHMAFNGTKNFPGKGVLNFLEKAGIKFGHGVNAFTSYDVTAYNLSNVPTSREGIIDTALLVLHDWSGSISLEEKEIDAERGVIREEWRTYRVPEVRIEKVENTILYKGSQYAKRDIIGSLDIINNFEYDAIRKFYKDWYRPDLQALVLVGDFDVNVIEAKVQKLFSAIPKATDPKPRPYFEIPDHDELLTGVTTDPEASRTQVEIYYKHPAIPEGQKNLGYYRNSVVNSLFQTMLNGRLNELVQKENPAFVFAYGYYASIQRTKNAFVLTANAREKESERTLSTLLQESYRAYQHGFTQTELDRAKADILRASEKRYNEREKLNNQSFVWLCFSHFLTNEPMPSMEMDFMFKKSLLPSINLDEVNKLAGKYISDKNNVILLSGPEKEAATMPSKERIAQIVNEVKASKLEAYFDNVKTEPLLATLPKPGKVAKEKPLASFGSTELILSNGVKVIYKTTNFKEDEILFSGFSPGGYSLNPSSDVPSALFTSTIAIMGGLGKFTKIELDKMMAGKVVTLSPFIGENEEGFNGSCSPKDLETLFQMVHLFFTQPRFDETAFNAYLSRIQAVYQNSSTNPNMIFRDSTSFISSNRNIRKRPMSVDLLKEVNFGRIQSIYHDRFSNAGDFTFVLTGNIKPEELKKLAELYLGSLPNTKRKETWKDNGVRFPVGKTKNPFAVAMQDPKTSVYVSYRGKSPYNPQAKLFMNTISHVLELRYTEVIREEFGATYGVATVSSLSKIPESGFEMTMFFDTDPNLAEKMTAVIHAEVEKISKEGPSETDLGKARENFLKTYQEKLRENRYWLSAIREFCRNGVDDVTGYEELVKKLSVKEVKQAASKLFDPANMLEVVMSPAK